MKIITLIISIILLTFVVTGISISYSTEYKKWNKGKCNKCGRKWQITYIGYEGERHYKCIGKWCKNHCVISFKTIDRGGK